MKLSEKFKEMGVSGVIISQIEALEEQKQEWYEQQDRLEALATQQAIELQDSTLSVEGQIMKIRALKVLIDSDKREKLREAEESVPKVLRDLTFKFDYMIERARMRINAKEQAEQAQKRKKAVADTMNRRHSHEHPNPKWD